MDGDLRREVTSECRLGDIRNCYTDTTEAEEFLDFQAKIPLVQIS